ncbi:MAG: ABC transporter ATP-binding protein [Rhodospirillales bacterium]|nr:ABC transporter ATP-binding protein [Rhodospirillales bacterium]MBN8927666.1 ABC transporter ATP-binding protein [Rhodospirillales bacterium]
MGEPILAVENVSKRFGGVKAVDGVSFSVARGEILGVIGPNGAGKSTLFGLISGFIPPDTGSVRFQGQDLAGQAPHRIAARGLSRSFQIVQVFSEMTVLETVITAALLRHDMRGAEKRAHEVLDAVGLTSRANRDPVSLTLQDKKLLELAKCIATEPSLLLLDEVMAGLTLAEAEVPLRIISRLRAEGLTCVLVEHVMPIVMKTVDRLVVLNFGRKVAEGSIAEVIADPDVKAAYFGEEPGDA